MAGWCLHVMVVLVLVTVHYTNARNVPSDAGLDDQKELHHLWWCGGAAGITGTGLPFAGVGGIGGITGLPFAGVGGIGRITGLPFAGVGGIGGISTGLGGTGGLGGGSGGVGGLGGTSGGGGSAGGGVGSGGGSGTLPLP